MFYVISGVMITLVPHSPQVLSSILTPIHGVGTFLCGILSVSAYSGSSHHPKTHTDRLTGYSKSPIVVNSDCLLFVV